MLCAAEADALGAEGAGHGSVMRRIGVGAHLEALGGVAPGHDLGEAPIELAVLGLQASAHQDLVHLGGMRAQLAGEHLAGGAVDGDPVYAGLQLPVPDSHDALREVDLQGGGAADTGLAHAAGDHGRVAGHAAAGR